MGGHCSSLKAELGSMFIGANLAFTLDLKQCIRFEVRLTRVIVHLLPTAKSKQSSIAENLIPNLLIAWAFSCTQRRKFCTNLLEKFALNSNLGQY